MRPRIQTFSRLARLIWPVCLTVLLNTPVLAAPILHSHNDYERDRPLWNAIENKLDSVEADVWLIEDKIKLSHWGLSFIGSLEQFYLIPLRELVRKNGSVHGDGRPFYLWLDLKESNPELVTALHDLLEKYESLRGSIEIILTGDETAKELYVERYPDSHVVRDSNDFRGNDAATDGRWTWYALNWSAYFNWNGLGQFGLTEFARLKKMIDTIHEKGRKIRFYGTPEGHAYWQMLRKAGADMIATDHPALLRADIDSKPLPKLVTFDRKPEWKVGLDMVKSLFDTSAILLLSH